MYKEHIFSRGNDLKLAAFLKKKLEGASKSWKTKIILKRGKLQLNTSVAQLQKLV